MTSGRASTKGLMLRSSGAPWKQTLCVGLFGLDKLHNVEKTVANLAGALDRIRVVERVVETA